jgi:hypothetical protein
LAAHGQAAVRQDHRLEQRAVHGIPRLPAPAPAARVPSCPNPVPRGSRARRSR